MIIPYHREADFIRLAAKADLVPIRITHVRGRADTPLKRSLLQFAISPHSQTLTKDELVIEKERHEYTAAYKSIVHDFYLKM